MLQPAGQVAEGDLLDLRLREHLALDALATWCGGRPDLRALMFSAAAARELAGMGYGADQLPAIDRADKALAFIKALPLGPVGISGDDLAALRWLLQYHDAQRVAASCRYYHKALARIRQEPSRYGLWRN